MNGFSDRPSSNGREPTLFACLCNNDPDSLFFFSSLSLSSPFLPCWLKFTPSFLNGASEPHSTKKCLAPNAIPLDLCHNTWTDGKLTNNQVSPISIAVPALVHLPLNGLDGQEEQRFDSIRPSVCHALDDEWSCPNWDLTNCHLTPHLRPTACPCVQSWGINACDLKEPRGR